MKQELIIFRSGEENGIVIERENFKSSIFVDQYQQAIDLFARLWERQKSFQQQTEDYKPKVFGIDNQFSNIIAFCGDRGEGKTSSMISFATLLTDNNVREKAKEALVYPLDNTGKEMLPSSKEIEWLDVIDPSFFDEQHNLLELMLGQMYAKASEISDQNNESQRNEFAYKRRKLMEQFQIVKNSIHLLECDDKLYDSISEMSDLSASVQLKTDIQKLFKCYLDFSGKKCLLICVDDIDLNTKNGYGMAEMLRKYFICPYCLILVAVNIEQLIDVISNHHKIESTISEDNAPLMAQKYVAKLFPRGNRIPMPAIEDICERKIKLADSYGKKEKDLEKLTVKERVVQLIFQKTGYVFYNGQYLSPIVPTNLRGLRHLLGTLEALPDARSDNWEDNETGREIFKDYLFGTWVDTNLTKEDCDFARRLSQYNNLTTLNAFVVEYFAKRVKKSEIEIKEQLKSDGKKSAKDDRGEGDVEIFTGDYAPLYLQITNRTNTSSNISIGDVMYVLWLISTITVDSDIQNLIFFIKTLYSIKLYACYNELTEGKDDTLFPKINNSESRINIHKSDSLYDDINRVQRIISGSYFSYPEGALLSNKRDRIIIDFRKAKILFNQLKEEAKKKDVDRCSNYVQLVNLCEYIAMCITFASTKENIEKVNFSRIKKTPTFLGTHSNTANYAIFDFLNPFYALTNIKYAYHRCDEILSDSPNNYSDSDESQRDKLFNIAENCEHSLLSQMKQIRGDVYGDKWAMHGLISDAIIRVTDIQWAIYEELLRNYRQHRIGSVSEKIYHAYGDIQKLNITLYPRLNIDGGKVVYGYEAHPITFEFLGILRSFLSDPSNANQLDQILIMTEAEKIVVDTAHFMTDMHKALMHIYQWPQSGAEIKKIIKETSSLDKSQLSSFSARLGKLFNSDASFSLEEAMGMLNAVRNIYIIARSK